MTTLNSLKSALQTPSPSTPGGGEAYLGQDMPQDESDRLVRLHWPEKDQEKELRLFQSKWWDHRHLSVCEATYLFCHLFTVETRSIIRAHIDDRPPRLAKNGKLVDWSPLGNDPIKPPKDEKAQKRWRIKLNGIIRARQWADQHGIPYEFFVKCALRKIYFGQMYLLQFTKLPDTKMLNGAEMREHVLLQWAERLEAQIQYGRHDRYVLVNGCGHADVHKHQDWIVEQIKRRSHPHFALGKFIGMGLLDRDSAADAFGFGLVDKALRTRS